MYTQIVRTFVISKVDKNKMQAIRAVFSFCLHSAFELIKVKIKKGAQKVG